MYKVYKFEIEEDNLRKIQIMGITLFKAIALEGHSKAEKLSDVILLNDAG